MEKDLSNHEDLNLLFPEVNIWDKYEYCETMRVWLEILVCHHMDRNWNVYEIIDI